jgi:SPP1 family predicted phage head-tail adaptor
MDRQIKLWKPTSTRSSSGAEIVYHEPPAVQTVWAKVAKTSPVKEVAEGKQRTALSAKVFQIRWRTDIQETWVIEFDGWYYNITGIEEVGRKMGLIITTEKRDHARTLNILPA